jgi:hypothetical protein
MWYLEPQSGASLGNQLEIAARQLSGVWRTQS